MNPQWRRMVFILAICTLQGVTPLKAQPLFALQAFSFLSEHIMSASLNKHTCMLCYVQYTLHGIASWLIFLLVIIQNEIDSDWPAKAVCGRLCFAKELMCLFYFLPRSIKIISTIDNFQVTCLYYAYEYLDDLLWSCSADVQLPILFIQPWLYSQVSP